MEYIDNVMETIFENKYYSSIITLVLILYSSVVAPKLPNSILKLFDNSIFRILILSLIVYYGNKNTKLSLIIAVGFTVSMNLLSKRKMFENFTDMNPISNNMETTDSNTMTPGDSNEVDSNMNLQTTSEPQSEPSQPQSEQSQPPSDTTGQPSGPSQPPSRPSQPPSGASQPPVLGNNPQETGSVLKQEKTKGEKCKIEGEKSDCLKGLYCDPTNRKCRKKKVNEICTILENDSDDCEDNLYCDRNSKVCKKI